MHAPRFAGLLLLILAILGCEDEPAATSPKETSAGRPASSAAPGPSAKPSRPRRPAGRTYNVLLIMVDSLRADMPWTGYERPVAPWLSQFAENATLYPRAYALSSYTAKSVVPALVGKYPSELPRDGYFFTVWPPQNVLVGERLQEAGHRTLAGHGHGYFLPALGTSQGFDDYRLLPGTHLELKGVSDVTSERLTALAKDMLSDPKNTDLAGGKRFFAYFHFLDPHYTYIKHDGHPDFGDERRDVYDNEVHYTDEWVGNLVDFVRKRPFGDDTAVIITADHGEGFGEHGHYRHAYELWEALVRVPLMIQVPGAEARRIDVPRGHIDLAPTILDLMGVAIPDELRGESLVPEIWGAEPELRSVLADLPRCDLMDRRRAFIDGDYKLISFGDDARLEMYKVSEDFEERRELSKSDPERFADLEAKYQRFVGDIPNVPVIGGAPLKGAPAGRRW